jgi:hypothetical protein
MTKLLELLEAAKSEAAKLLSTQRLSHEAEAHWLEENYNIPRMQHDMNRFNHLLCWTQEQQKAYHRYQQLRAEQPAFEEEIPAKESPEQELARLLRRQYDLAGMERTMAAAGHINMWRKDCREAYHRVKELEVLLGDNPKTPALQELTVDLTGPEARTLYELLMRVVPSGFCANPRDAVPMASAVKKVTDALQDMLGEE